ncbi:hypothetical protein AB8U03_16170 [Clostridium sp. Mt-5]|uniref:Uncharacterized protein n=1 Tax=Clostridium moutaii TaxID=3240932 RepID=A0ABV4BUI5_9CLOT
MDVNSIMSTYYMNSLWNNLNSTSTTPNVPLVNNIDSTLQEDYTASNYFGQNTSTELQDIYQQVEPTYGIPLAYSSLGDLSIPTNITPPSNGLPPAESNIASLLQGNNTETDNINENILSQYDAIENSTYQYSYSNILSSNPNDIYNTIDSLSQPIDNNLDTLV